MTEWSPGDPVELSEETVADLDAPGDPTGGRARGMAMLSSQDFDPCVSDELTRRSAREPSGSAGPDA
ncbi:MAG: hypothetical protein L0I76_13135 [Pseudonocardia sp.]|nr:hypothetical protein [Pseudonocardia sp.]